MRKSVLFVIFCSLIICVHTLCGADSLIVPMQFPKTFNDLDFVTRMDFKEEDYNRYADLNPYEQWILEIADENLEKEMAEDDAQQSITATTDTGTSSNPSISSDQSSVTTTPATNGYCQMRQPGIPQNQKIPFGSPVLHEHFIYCSPYAELNRGAGCRLHTGYDIGCSRKDKNGNITHESFGDPVFATADGVVETVKHNQRGKSHGNYIKINHENGFYTWYMHLNEMFVTQGQRVSAGCQIGTIGNTGGSLESIKGDHSNDPRFGKRMAHVHYEMWYKGSLHSVTTPTTNKNVLVTHGWSGHSSIDPTQFICVYDNFSTGYCGKTFPYQSCPVRKTN